MNDKDIKRWDNVSLKFSEWAETSPYKQEFVYPLVLSSLKSIDAKNILDIGCASGEFSRLLARKEARVVGIDGSLELLKIARAKSKNLKINYLKFDLGKKINFPSGYFDFVAAIHSLMNIDKYEKTIRESFRVLKSGGKFIFTIPHPCFTTPVFSFRRRIWGRICLRWSTIRWEDYFTNRKIDKDVITGCPIGHYHRKIEDYLNQLLRAGLMVTNFREPKLPKKVIGKLNSLPANFFPDLILIEAIKP